MSLPGRHLRPLKMPAMIQLSTEDLVHKFAYYASEAPGRKGAKTH